MSVPAQRLAVPPIPMRRVLPAAGKASWKSYISFPLFLWFILWGAVNTEPERIVSPTLSSMDIVHQTRALGPMIGFLLAWFWMGRSALVPLPIPLKIWAAYGCVGLIASFQSENLIRSAWWAMAYLGIIAVVKVNMPVRDTFQSLVRVNRLSWGIITLVLVVLLIAAREYLYVETAEGGSMYGLIQRVESVGSMPMSRETGLARMASVPAIVAFVGLWYSRSMGQRLSYLVVLGGSGYLIYLMQSRGALLALLLAFATVTYFMGTRSRVVGVLFAGTLALAVFSEILPQETTETLWRHVTRGDTSFDALAQMTGRVNTWERAMHAVAESPLVGWGYEADRWMFGEHAHNTYVYALLTGGFLGVSLLIFGLAWTWISAFLAAARGRAEQIGHASTFLQCVGILAFFTARGIPEVCGASFSIDTLIMVPAMAFIYLVSRVGTWDEPEDARRLRMSARRT